MKKRRVLFLSEAHFLLSGFATYAKEVLTRLHQMDKFEICEFACYARSNDDQLRDCPWLVYGNAPLPGDHQYEKRHKEDEMAQFGAYRFDRTILEFKPDIVFTMKDNWMTSFNMHSYHRA